MKAWLEPRSSRHSQDDCGLDSHGSKVGLAAKLRSVQQASSLASRCEEENIKLEEQKAAGQLVDLQHLFMSISKRNPGKGLLCEPPKASCLFRQVAIISKSELLPYGRVPHVCHWDVELQLVQGDCSTACRSSFSFKFRYQSALQVQCINYYQAGDTPLAAFLAGASPSQPKKCPTPDCGEGPASHMISYLHGKGLITFSITQLPEGKELPGAAKGHIWFWARPTEVRRPQVHCLLSHFTSGCGKVWGIGVPKETGASINL